MKAIISPSTLKGKINVPPSKSMLHRAIIAASLASGTSNIFNVSYSDDIKATIDAMRKLGANITCNENSLLIIGNKIKIIDNYINANESGSTLRFIMPLALTSGEKICFDGNNNLKKRPLDEYLNIFDIQNIKYEKGDNYLPLYLEGKLHSGVFKIKGNVSSQYITGLLFAIPLLNGDSKIIIEGEVESKNYIDLTIDILKLANINVINNNYQEFIINGKQEYKPFDIEIEGDYSQAAFYFVANKFGANILINNLNNNSKQGDKKIIEDISLIEKGNAILSFKQTPDLFPIEVILASCINKTTTFKDLNRLKIKESNRILAMVNNLKRLGVNIIYENDIVTIKGNDIVNGGNINSYNDHRIVMAFAVLSLKASSNIIIDNIDCVKKSYPNFFDDFEKLGGKIERINKDE